MGGKASRDKGLRGERSLRDHLRKAGWKADRVPSSGAAQGFPGDVLATKDGKEVLFEMKFRKAAFTSLYALYDAHKAKQQDDVLSVAFEGTHAKQLVCMSTSLDAVFDPAEYHTFYQLHPCYVEHKRAFARLPKLQSLLKEAHILVLKDNLKPLLFLRFR